MTYVLVPAEMVIALHDAGLKPDDLQGLAMDKSLERALSRVDNRLVYGMIEDVFDLAAAYATAVATGHCLNDGNKRTAFQAMNFCLFSNGILIDWGIKDVGDKIIALAHRQIDDADLAVWLRAKAQA